MIIAAIQVTGLVERSGIQQAMAGLEEALYLGELLTGIFTLESHHCCVVTGLSQSHILGLITTIGERLTSSIVIILLDYLLLFYLYFETTPLRK